MNKLIIGAFFLLLMIGANSESHATIIEYQVSGNIQYLHDEFPKEYYTSLPIVGSIYILDEPDVESDYRLHFDIIGYSIFLGDSKLISDVGELKFTPYGRINIGGESFELKGLILPTNVDPYLFEPPEYFEIDPWLAIYPNDWVNQIDPIENYHPYFSYMEFSAVPVPEPSSIALLSCGLIGFIIRRKFIKN